MPHTPLLRVLSHVFHQFFPFLFLLIIGFKIQIFERNAFEGKTNRSFFRLINTLRAEATFSLCEMACEKQLLPTTVQIRLEIWTNKLKKTGFFFFLTGLEHCVSLALVFVWGICTPHEVGTTYYSYKQLLDEVFAISRMIKVEVGVIKPKPKAEADNPYQDLDYSGYHKN